MELRANELSEKFQIPNAKSQIHARIDDLETAVAVLTARLTTTILDNAISTARILPCERDFWANQLAADFDTASTALANTQPKLNTAPKTTALPIVTTPNISGPPRTTEILKLVNERMRSTGLSYHQAWSAAKTEHPHLFS